MSPIETFKAEGFPINKKEPECPHQECLHTPLEVELEEFLAQEFGILEHHGVEDEIRGYWGNLYIIGRSKEEATLVYSYTSAPFNEEILEEDLIEISIVASKEILSRIKKVLA